MDPHGREPTAPRAWRPRFRRLWPHAAVGCVVTLVLAWALPLALLAGRGGGTIATGRHVSYSKGTPLANLWQGMLKRVGTPVERFADSTGELAGLDDANFKGA